MIIELMKKYEDKIPLILAIVLYVLVYFVRFQQGGWEINLDLFPKLRDQLNEKIISFLPSPKAELLSGIVLGIKQELPPGLKLALRDTSTLHMVVVSGQNLSLLAAFLIRLSGLLTRKVAIGLTTIMILGYVVLTGGEIPVLRAALMALFAFLAQVLGRQSDGFWILLLIAGLLLLINPFWITDLSFQLSFLATFGLVVIAPILENYFKWLPAILREHLVITVSAQLMVTPIILQNFHQLSLVGIPANLLVLWTIPYIMGGGLIMLSVSVLSDVFGQAIAWILNILLTYFIYNVQFFASLPFAWKYVGEQIWIVWAGYYMLLLGIMLSLNYGKTEDS